MMLLHSRKCVLRSTAIDMNVSCLEKRDSLACLKNTWGHGGNGISRFRIKKNTKRILSKSSNPFFKITFVNVIKDGQDTNAKLINTLTYFITKHITGAFSFRFLDPNSSGFLLPNSSKICS